MSTDLQAWIQVCRLALWAEMFGSSAPVPRLTPVPEEAKIVARETLQEFGVVSAGNLNQHRALFSELQRRAKMEWEVLNGNGVIHDPDAQ